MDATNNAPRPELVLRDYLGIVKRQKWLILGITLAVTVIGLGYSLSQPKVYQANTSLLVDPGEGFETTRDTDSPLPSMGREYRILRSQNMRRAINERLGYLPRVDASMDEDATVVTVTAEDGDPAKAVKYADDYTTAFVAERRAATAEEIQGSITDLENELATLDQEVATARARIDELNIQIALTDDVEQKRVLTAERDRLRNSVDGGSVANRQSNLQTTLDALQIRAAFNESRGFYTVTKAVEPSDPVSPTPAKDGGIALALGLVLGLCAALLRDYLDDTLSTKEDVDAASGGVPVLGIIPAIETWKHKEEALLETVAHPSSAPAEAFRGLRTSLEFVGIERKLRIIHVTSSTPGEGKSTTAANLAVVLARAGKRVVLLDCDLRKPRVHDFFGMANETGFTSVLVGDARIEEALKPAPGVPGLLVLPAGPVPPNPSELLSTQAARTKIEALAKSADYVVIDSPPLLPVSDSVILAGYAHATLLVVRSRTTTKRSLGRSLEVLAQVDGPLEGVVFNGAGSEATYGYGYGYGYTSEERARAASILPWRRGKGGRPNQNGSDERFDALTARERSDGLAGGSATPSNGVTVGQHEGDAAHEAAEESTPAPPRP